MKRNFNILIIIASIFIEVTSYAQNSPKTKIRLFEQTTVFDSVVSKNDSMYIYAGDTVFKTQIADADWYKVGTTSSPSSINDSIYTIGQVGIGTNSPKYTLSVDAGVLNDTFVRIEGGAGVLENISLNLWDKGTAANNRNVIEFGHNATYVPGARVLSQNIGGGAVNGTRLYLETTSDNIGTWNTNQLVLDVAGEVGIGTLTPNKKLHVAGGVQMGDNGVYTDLIFETATPLGIYNQTFDIYPRTIPGTGTSEALTYFRNASSTGTTQHDVAVDGLVGIGTAAPANQLHIAGGTNPIKAEGLQPAQTNDTTLLVTNPADGTVRYLRLDSIFNKEGKLFYAAEYAGGVFDTIKGTAGNHSGFMTSNNAKAPDYMNFYEWFTPKTTLQSYDIVLRLEAPLDFASWTTTTIDNMAEASGSLSVEIRNVTQGTVINPITNLSNAAWTTTALNMNTLATNPEDIILIIVTMNSVNSDFVRAGDVKLRYNK